MAAPGGVVEAAGPITIGCADFLAFQEVLKKSRTIDDKIIYALNKSLPTQSFEGQVDASKTCKDLYSKLRESYRARGAAIRRCVEETAGHVEALRQRREVDQDSQDNYDLLRELRREQSKLRLYRSELSVEEVVRDRSRAIVSERCRLFYAPDPSTDLLNN
ncbi:coiled-coil domain-containing protein 58-like [Pollicipes pollicipes]|uniref:coiled-coil domain-containing protein 58-like n=1 Tax=Pollicipes pollicipes TaxID=41117 RepID=UPI00188585DE|nr:coiled-coil domain-containing protein 58-like [Pollicipes pollicipes]